ncbi:hypothetical protein M5K25_017864 [Dendrobium thyrsiflorum]|uniref:TPX2 C-terminal domain-containing protein n=1 Tax=Dendrobium thyrsiflorum TaxID=117978 RepID=A0ABD0UH56_DENTH
MHNFKFSFKKKNNSTKQANDVDAKKRLEAAYEKLRASQEEFFKKDIVPVLRDEESRNGQKKEEEIKKSEILERKTKSVVMAEAMSSIPEPGARRVKHLAKAFESLLSISDGEESGKSTLMDWLMPKLPRMVEQSNGGSSSPSFASVELFAGRGHEREMRLCSSLDGLDGRLSLTSRTSGGGQRSRRHSLDSSRKSWNKRLKVTNQQPFKLRIEKMASSSKRSRISKGSSSSRNENFLSKECETAYGRYSASKITPSRILIQSNIDFQILPPFSSTQLSFILTLSHSYHKEITEGDRLHTLIQESGISWSLVNDTLRGNKDKFHQPRVYTLLQNARIIQHVLRSSIIPKAGDRVNMTPLLSMVTHLIMSDKPFDEAQLILDYIHSLSDIRHPQTKRKKNIALGHLVCYILEKKYNLIYPEPPTEEPIFFTNASFRSLVHDPTVEGEDSEGEKEAPSEPAPVPNQNAFQDMIQRFDTMETNFGQRFDQIDLHLKIQEDRHNLDMAWIRGQTDYINQNVAMINSYFTAFNPQHPPDQDPGIRGRLKEERFVKKVTEMLLEEEKKHILIAQGVPWTIDEPEECTEPLDIVLHSDVRAIERAKFDQYVMERLELAKQFKLERERRQKMEAEEIRRLRRELVPRAHPMPYFDRPFIPKK